MVQLIRFSLVTESTYVCAIEVYDLRMKIWMFKFSAQVVHTVVFFVER